MTEEKYYQQIEALVGKTISYCGMDCKVTMIAKYVKPKNEHIVGFKALYILKIINPNKEDLETFDGGYLYASDSDIEFAKSFDKD
jgi:hypothetical protein